MVKSHTFGLKDIYSEDDILLDPISRRTKIKNMQQAQPTMLAIPNAREYLIVKEDEILYCQSDGNYCYINFLDGRKLLISKKLKTMEEVLNGSIFLRVHNSFLVNMLHVKKVILQDGSRMILSNGDMITISRTRKKELLNYLKRI